MLKEVYRQGPSKVSKHCADFRQLNVIDIAPSSVSNKAAFHRALLNNSKNIQKLLDLWTPLKDPVFHMRFHNIKTYMYEKNIISFVFFVIFNKLFG